MGNIKLGCVIMASGYAKRFGSNKLLADFCGEPLICHTFKAIPNEAFSSIVVVTQYNEIRQLALAYGFCVLINDMPDQGISNTVKLGTRLLHGCDAIMFAVGDQPFITQQAICKAVDLYMKNTDKIIAVSYNGKKGNPCIFPKKFFNELMQLSGDVGGSVIIKNHPESLLLSETDAKQLLDIDKPTDMYDI